MITKSVKIPAPAAEWTADAKSLWTATMSDYVLEPHHIELLRAACQQLSRAAEARAAIDADGVIIEDRFGIAKEHPALSVERQSHLAYLRLVREMGLDIDLPESRGPRRPGTGV